MTRMMSLPSLDGAAGVAPEKEALIAEKENLIIRYQRLTEEALRRLVQEEEEKIPEILEKREALIQDFHRVDSHLKDLVLTEDEEQRLRERKAELLALENTLREQMETQCREIKAGLGKTRQAQKVNRAYQGNSQESLLVNRKK